MRTGVQFSLFSILHTELRSSGRRGRKQQPQLRLVRWPQQTFYVHR